MVIYNLKIYRRWFDAIESGKMNFEIRLNDHDYEEGDILILCEFENGFYTGRKLERSVSYVLHGQPKYGIIDGFCILGLTKKRYKM